MDLLTKEQVAEVERIRGEHKTQYISDENGLSSEIHNDRAALLSILDEAVKTFNAYSLLSEAVRSLHRQHTEAELQAEFESTHSITYCTRTDQGEYASERTRVDWRCWLECARHFGLIKE